MERLRKTRAISRRAGSRDGYKYVIVSNAFYLCPLSTQSTIAHPLLRAAYMLTGAVLAVADDVQQSA